MGIVHHPQELRADQMILKTLQQQLRPLSRAELVQMIPRYSQTTIQRNLKKLKDKRKIQVVGNGRNTRYILYH